MTQYAIGNFLDFTAESGTTYRFQNFFIGQTVSYQGNDYGFVPFGFSGVTINRTGDNTEASLIFPNNDLSRRWAVDAVNNYWLAHVRVLLVDPDNISSFELMHEYYGRIAQGKWDETSLELQVNSVLDAVGADVPVRRLTQKLIGSIPVSNAINLQ